nr:MAG TPA: hypothetical protein [Caudoviricetes sp.]
MKERIQLYYCILAERDQSGNFSFRVRQRNFTRH